MVVGSSGSRASGGDGGDGEIDSDGGVDGCDDGGIGGCDEILLWWFC